MITFKQYLAEISHDDSISLKDASHFIATRRFDASEWKHLMMVDDYEVVWKPVSLGATKFKLVLKSEDKPAIVLEVGVKDLKLPGGRLQGIYPESLSSNELFRGKGLALKLYKELVRNGQVLFSSQSQTSGSRKLWEQLIQSDVGEPFVLAEGAAARWYQNKYKKHEGSLRVLLTGDFNSMEDEAYADDETSWVIVPHNMVGDLKKNAINLNTEPDTDE